MANDPESSTEDLAKLSKSNDVLILSALALNPSTPIPILNSLAELDDKEVNSALRKRKSSIVHPTSIVSPRAVLGHNVRVGAYTLINDNVVIGDETVIDSNCEIGYATPLAGGEPLVIGNSTTTG